MEVSDTESVRLFDGDGFGKVSLFETPNFFADVYCFEAGEAQEAHAHEDEDKLYHVLEGEAEVTVGDERMTVSEGETVLAEAGSRHGVVASERARLLVFMAPHPGASDDEGGGHEGHEGHDHGHAHEGGMEGGSFDVGFVTVSSSRDASADESGDVARGLVEDAGHTFAEYTLVPDDKDEVRDAVVSLTDDNDAVFTSGGTGLTGDDVTVETVRPLFDKELPGFGEEFRRRSVDEIGPMGPVSRALAGVELTVVAQLVP
jgi:molybdenum cofactor biosynthesis protein B